jgi:predicted NAD/FAD-dependent oxidoreductase
VIYVIPYTSIIEQTAAVLACGEALVAAGHVVALFDKGRGAGGRMSSRRLATPLGEVGFDHGAQYVTARDPAFRRQVQAWSAAGLVAPWPAAGEGAWVGAPAMNAPLKAMSAALDVRWRTRVETLTREASGWRVGGGELDEGGYDAVLCALPAEQAAALLGAVAPAFANRAAAARSDPCWTVMAGFADRLPIDADVLRRDGDVAWAARNSAKPGRTGPESWVVQASADWSRRHLERSEAEVAGALLSAFHAATGTGPRPTAALAAHRWRYARPAALDAGALWDAAAGIGACGDWLCGPRVECAWLSGRQLAGRVG